MKWYIPREHGAWAMLIVPYLLGMVTSNVTWYHLFFFIGVLAMYFASAPFLAYVRQPKLTRQVIPSFLVYLSIGTIFTVPILYFIPEIVKIGLFIVPFFCINVLFAKLKKERLFMNDLFAILALSFLVLISYYIGNGEIDKRAIILMTINFIFFIASVFHVKTLIREKGNKWFLWQSHLFHGSTVLIFILIGLPVISLVFLIGSLKAWFMPRTKRYKPIQIGLIELGNSVAFVVLLAIFY